MSHFERNLEYLNSRRIIYRRDPQNDKPTEVFDWGAFYKEGTRECYTLFRSRAKINTYKSLKWHLYVLWYLNPQLDQDDFAELTKIVCNRSAGFVTFKVSPQLKESMIYDVSMQDLETPPPNKIRKVIFKDYCGLSTSEKLSIVGELVGKKKLSETEIYDGMLILYDEGSKITIAKLAKELKCSTRTIYRHMSNELKKEKELLNQQL
jgi:hypothetical protein